MPWPSTIKTVAPRPRTQRVYRCDVAPCKTVESPKVADFAQARTNKNCRTLRWVSQGNGPWIRPPSLGLGCAPIFVATVFIVQRQFLLSEKKHPEHAVGPICNSKGGS